MVESVAPSGSPYCSGTLIRHGTRRCVRAILEGLDDRLLVCIEPSQPVVDLPRAGRRVAAWRAGYADELEVLAFVRSDEAFGNDGEAASAGRISASCWHRLGLPLVVGLASAVPRATERIDAAACRGATLALEQWTWPDNDMRLLLGARYPCADLLLRLDDDAHAAPRKTSDALACAACAPRLAFGCRRPYDARVQAALVEQIAADCACGRMQACGIVIACPADRNGDDAASETDALLSALAQAVRYRRFARAAREHAPLRPLARSLDFA